MQYFDAIIAISASDLLKLDLFSGMTEEQLISPVNDWHVRCCAYQVGADTSKDVCVQACLHRNLANEKVLGYRYVWPERKDKEWLSGKRCSIAARISAAEVRDPSLAFEMGRMNKEGFSSAQFQTMCRNAAGKDGTTKMAKKEDVELSYGFVRKELARLSQRQIDIRGNLWEDENMLSVSK